MNRTRIAVAAAAAAGLVVLLLLVLRGGDERVGREAIPLEEMPSRAVLETSEGEIVLALQAERAPRAASSFVRHAREGFYDGMLIHRVIPGELFQVGRYAGDGSPTSPLYPAVPLEADPELGHAEGAVSLARYADPASASAEFIVHARPHPELDGEYAVFARVVEGMEVVRRIVDSEVEVHDGSPDWPTRELRLESVRLR